MKINQLNVGEKVKAVVRLARIPVSGELEWTVTKVNKSSYSVHWNDGKQSLNLYLCMRTGQIKR